MYIRQVTASAQDGFYITVFTSKSDLLLYIPLELGISLAIGIYQFLALATAQGGLLAESYSRDPVDNPEIHRLGVTTLFLGNCLQGDAKDLSCGGTVDVLPLKESLYHMVFLTQGCDNTELYL